jgi:hypothetical protein
VKKTFDDTILLSLKRNYTQDEAVAYLAAELSKAKFRIGELESETAELRHLARLREVEKPAKLNKLEAQKDEYTATLIKRLQEKGIENGKLQKEKREWQQKYFNLEFQLKR